ncbi:hypothetical protein U9M48_004363 [Paspalum notatum var. saurae]|uniref:Uncharacterized protein n=1 Tax=Paspalum notatum var. saurae TaxID=547442 RepID=A0AAQ3SJ00_PASNO
MVRPLSTAGDSNFHPASFYSAPRSSTRWIPSCSLTGIAIPQNKKLHISLFLRCCCGIHLVPLVPQVFPTICCIISLPILYIFSIRITIYGRRTQMFLLYFIIHYCF